MQTTIGQRIAEERKRLGLSQEALGEQVGVSRQAISKWESDAAIPEIDKLIALSKLYNVSVGYLLGVEENKSEPEENPGFSDAQLEMIQELLRQYQTPAEKPKKSMLTAAALLLAGVSLVFAISANRKLRNYPDYSNQLSNLQWNYNQISGQLSSVSYALEQLQNQTNVLDDCRLLLYPAEDLSGVTVKFSGVPKVLQQGDTAVFSVHRENEEIVHADCSWNGTAYTAEVFVPKDVGYQCTFALTHADGTTELYTIPNTVDGAELLYYELENGLRYSTFAAMICSFSGRQPKNLQIDQIEIHIEKPFLLEKADSSRCVQIDMITEYNGTDTARDVIYAPGQPIQTAFIADAEYNQEGYLQVYLSAPKQEFPLPFDWQPGDIVRFRLEATYSDGKVLRFYIPNALVCAQDGSVEIDYRDETPVLEMQ